MQSTRCAMGARAASLGLVGFVASSPFAISIARADTAPPASTTTSANGAAAQELFDEGRALMAHSRFADAYPKLAESQRLDPGMGTEFNLADCEEHLGKTASAWAHYLDVADAAKISGQTARERVARTRASALEPHLSRLRVSAPTNGQTDNGVEIRRDGVIVGAGQYGVAVPVDPGEHHMTATAPGKKAWAHDVKTLADATIVVDVPRLEDVPAPAVALPAPVAPPGPSQEERERASRAHTQRIAGIAVAAVGVVGIGVGTAFGLVSKVKHDDSDANGHCNGDSCDATGVSLRSDAIHAGNISTIAFVAGGAALLGGGILFFIAPKTKERDGSDGATGPSRASFSAAPLLAPGIGGVAFGGRF